MDLIITKYNNFVKMKGVLNKRTLNVFFNELETILEKPNCHIISVEAIEAIDKHGLNALVNLHNEALAKGKKLAILGFGCKDLYNQFKSEAA